MSLYVVKAKKTTLKANFAPSDTQVTLKALVDSQGNELEMASFGEWGALVIKQGDSIIEITKFDDITQNADGSATLDIATNGRNILPVTPYTGSATGENFLAGAEVIVTNDPLTMMTFGNLNNANTWDEIQTFTQVPVTNGGNAVTDNQLVRKLQLDQAVLGITTSVKIVVGGTAGETVSAGQLLYLKSADNRWWKADADIASSVDNVILGIAQGAGIAGGSIASGILLRGVDANQSALTVGVKYYASNTAGDISTSAGTVEVTVGISKSATELYFDPRFDQQLTEDQQDALAGTSGTPPSASNKFVDNADTSGTGAVVRNSLLAGIAGSFFGNGADGDVTIPSGTTTITKDMYYNNLTIQTGGVLNPSGFRIFVAGTLTFQGTGIIARNGNAGSNGTNGGNGSAGSGGSGGGGGNGGSALASGTIYGGEAGGNGGGGAGGSTGGGSNGNAGSQATTPTGITNAIGSSASAGTGAGGASGGGFNGNSGASGGSAGTGTTSTVTNPTIMPNTASNAIFLHTIINSTVAFMKGSAGSVGGSGGAGGAGGNQGAGSYAGGGGGGGGGAGSTGGIVMVCAYAIVGGTATCIQALGGTGGNGGNGGNPTTQFSGGGGSGGGGNGGTGGVVICVYHSYTGTALTTACVAGGAGGTKGATAGIAGTGGGSAGSLGSDGASGATGKLYTFAV